MRSQAHSGAVFAGLAEAATGVRQARMTMFSFFKRTTKAVVKSTPLSEFVRSRSADKKQLYVVALRRASELQREVVERATVRREDSGESECARAVCDQPPVGGEEGAGAEVTELDGRLAPLIPT